MTNLTVITALLIALICVWQAWYLLRAWRVWRRLRGERIVTCPETGLPAAVRIDAPHAATTTLIAGVPAVRLSECSRWSSRGPCDQPCVADAQAPERLLNAIVARWYEGQVCVYCGKAIDAAPFIGHESALLAPDGKTCEWSDVTPALIPATLQTHRPVCWNCHVTETFRRTYPELVTDREPQ